MDEQEAKEMLDGLGKFMKQTNEMIKTMMSKIVNFQVDIINLQKRLKKLEKDKQIIIP